jgi:hypothetical protein
VGGASSCDPFGWKVANAPMNPSDIASIIFACCCGAALVGLFLHARLPPAHLDGDSRDAVKLVMALIASMAALVLSLLIASANGTYQAQRSELQSLSADVLMLDRLLSFYGAEASGTRDVLRVAVEALHDRIWPPTGERQANFDPAATQHIADDFVASLLGLAPKTDIQKDIKGQSLQLAASIAHKRLLMFEQYGSSISWPFLLVLAFWLGTLFLGFGLFAHFNLTVTMSLLVGALSVGGAIFLILELDQPYAGVLRLSDMPLRTAMAAIDR